MDEAQQILLNEILTEQRLTRADVSEIKQSLAERKGERRVAVYLAGAISAVISLAVSLWK